ncbi:hypothetical protein [Kitasatospora purpeofusca]|uniref:hypothetical protein n=1 Tax=Kitasatospora purpeofusca TaxID=67352 RepID=UPI0038661BE6
MVADLVALPDFREAGSQARQRVVAYQVFPELASARNSWQVLEAAGLARQAALDRAYAGWEDRLPELAQELAATPQWKGATTVRTRTYRAQDFLRERAGGYPPAKRLVDLLLETPGLSRSRRA